MLDDWTRAALKFYTLKLTHLKIILKLITLKKFKFKFKFKSTGEGKPVACGPGAVSHSSAFLHKRNNIKPCIQTFGMLYQKQGEKR